MRIAIFRPMLAVALSCALWSCGFPKSGDATEQSAQGQFQGAWNMPCQVDAQTGSATEVSLVLGSDMTMSGSVRVFASSSCQGSETAEQDFQGRYALGTVSSDSSVPTTIGFQISRLTETIYDPVSAYAANGNASDPSCRIQNWHAGVAQDLSRMNGCIDESWIGQRRYGCLKVRNGSLVLGDNQCDGAEAAFVSAVVMRRGN